MILKNKIYINLLNYYHLKMKLNKIYNKISNNKLKMIKLIMIKIL